MNRGTRSGGGDNGGGGGVPHFMGNIFGRRSRAAAHDSASDAAARSSSQPEHNSTTAATARSSSSNGNTYDNNNTTTTAFTDFMEGLYDAASEAIRSSNLQQQQQYQPTTPSTAWSSSTYIPPASASFLQQLPQITVRPSDLRDPANRECCICLDAIVVGTTVTRLPYCAHLFHTQCGRDWWSRHCTCPTCRYELPTDDPVYEVGRQERMRHWKPRYARHELHAMRIAELKQLLVRRRRQRPLPAHIKDKASLIEYLIQQEGCIDLIPDDDDDGSPPCAFRISVLQQMSVRELRHVMNEGAGVFFDPKEVLEKQDMIRIFVASGRLQVVPEEEEEEDDDDNGDREDRKPAAVQVETVYSDTEDDDSGNDNNRTPRAHIDLVMEENRSFREPKKPTQARSAHQKRDVVDDDVTVEAVFNGPSALGSTPPLPPPPAAAAAAAAAAAVGHRSTATTADSLAESADNSENHTNSTVASIAAPESRDLVDSAGTENLSTPTTSTAASTSAASNESLPLTSFRNLSVSQAREVARQRGVDISDLLKVRDRLDRCIAERLAGVVTRCSSNTNSADENVHESDDYEC